MNDVYLLTGSNEGNRIYWLQFAQEAIEKQCGRIIQASSVYETAAWGNENQPAFLNMALRIFTALSPQEILFETQQIEVSAGRNRMEKWGQRTLDIDLLFYGNLVMENERLVIPHPQLHLRKFTLLPLLEIAPSFVHLVFNKTIAQLTADCIDSLEVKKLLPLSAYNLPPL